MAKMIDDAVLDAALDKLATADAMVLCDTQPANHAGLAAVALATEVMVAGDGNGDYDIANDVSGRKLTMVAQAAVDVDAAGDGDHVALDDGTTLLAVTTCSTQTVTTDDQVNFPEWKAGIADPT